MTRLERARFSALVNDIQEKIIFVRRQIHITGNFFTHAVSNTLYRSRTVKGVTCERKIPTKAKVYHGFRLVGLRGLLLRFLVLHPSCRSELLQIRWICNRTSFCDP